MTSVAKLLLSTTLFGGAAGTYLYKIGSVHEAPSVIQKHTLKHSAFRVGTYKDPSNCYATAPSSTTPEDLNMQYYPKHKLGRYYLQAALT
jgi:protein phosphatase PTC7